MFFLVALILPRRGDGLAPPFFSGKRVRVERSMAKGSIIEDSARAQIASLAFACLVTLAPPLSLAEVGPPVPLTSADVVTEAWGLLDKFYVDKSFNNQDWPGALERATTLASKQGSFKAIDSLAKSLSDKYTRVLDKEAYAQLARFDLIGAGVLFSPDENNRMSVASLPMEGSSAQKKGLKKGDLVLEINGQNTEGLTSFDVVDLVMASDDPVLELKIQDPSLEAPAHIVPLERKVASLPDPVSYRLIKGTKTGYIRLSEFNARCATRVREAVADLETKGAERYILDLRGNPGGTFQTAAKIAGIFMQDRVVVLAADGSGQMTKFKTSGTVLTDDPLVVLLDRGSASASEVLAGGLHDNCRGLIVGDRSFGKGLIQGVFGLSDGSGLVVTVARYKTPAGIDIQGSGVQPDINRKLDSSWLGGMILTPPSDMADQEWAEATARQGGELCLLE